MKNANRIAVLLLLRNKSRTRPKLRFLSLFIKKRNTLLRRRRLKKKASRSDPRRAFGSLKPFSKRFQPPEAKQNADRSTNQSRSKFWAAFYLCFARIRMKMRSIFRTVKNEIVMQIVSYWCKSWDDTWGMVMLFKVQPSNMLCKWTLNCLCEK